jgi:hypothetical protein
MAEKPSFDEIQRRIQRDIVHYHGKLPERFALVWYGYLAAIIEWGLISVYEHEQLLKLLPPIEDNPAVTILLGRSDES